MIFLETVMIGLIGAVAGAAVSIPVLLYMRGHPIHLSGNAAEAMLRYGYEPVLPFLVQTSIFVKQAAVVFILSLVAVIYPLLSVSHLKITRALRA